MSPRDADEGPQVPPPSAAPGPVPAPELVFDPATDRYGMRIPLVFGNHAPGGLCPYYVGGRCHHCDIGAGEGAAFDHAMNRARLVWFWRHYESVLPRVSHLVVYNSGSILSRREMPADMLGEILARAATLPALDVVSLDSREAFITRDVICAAAEALSPKQVVRPIIGLETSNDRLRNLYLRKKMPRRSVERAFSAVAQAGRALGSERVGVDINVLVAGPGTDARTAARDAQRTARYCLDLGRTKGVSVDLNLHPYYPSRRGFERFPHVGRCAPETVGAAVVAVCQVRDELAPATGIFVGVDDEGHDDDRTWDSARFAEARVAIDAFNVHQDPAQLAVALHVDSVS